MKIKRRWLESILAEAAKETPALPWQRGLRRRPASLKSAKTRPTPSPLRA